MTPKGRATVVDDKHVVRARIKCQGCKGAAWRVDDEIALHLRGEEEWLVPPAFECPRCQAIIFEDEFDEGRFVPPQFRKEVAPAIKRALG